MAGDYNPWAMAAYCTELTSTGHYWPGTLADTDTLNNFTDSTYSTDQIEGGVNTLLDAPDEATADDWMDDYFGVGGWNKTSDGDMPKADGRTKYGSNERHTTGDYPRTIHVDSWVFWNKPSPNMPKAFDVARTNANWLYVGLEDKIMKSENGGNDWTELTDDHGAYDICVDPQLAGAIYYWDTSGELRLRVAGVDQGSLLSDSALDQHGRIARDLNSGKLWVIDAYGDVQMREAGSWTTKKSGVSVGHSLRAYLGGKLIFMDAEDIYLSTDYGENWSNKKGGWSYADPVSVHLMKESS